MIKLKWLEQTSNIGCPSKWEGETVDDKFVFIRWRWDELRVTVGNHNKEYYDKNDVGVLSDSQVIYFEKYSTPWLTTDILKELLKDYIIFPED